MAKTNAVNESTTTLKISNEMPVASSVMLATTSQRSLPPAPLRHMTQALEIKLLLGPRNSF